MSSFDFTVRTRQDLLDVIEQFGFLPFFAGSIPGFSLEEHVAPGLWYSGNDTWPVWEWKGPVIRESGCAYGRFFENKAAFISRAWFADFANYRRDGYDFDARFDEGLAPFQDKELFDLIEGNAPILTRQLKALGNYRKGGKKGFDTRITRLQSQCYVLISDFVYATDKTGKPYGWGIAEYSTPEKQFCAAFFEKAYRRAPEESYQHLLSHLHTLFPDASEAALRKVLK